MIKKYIKKKILKNLGKWNKRKLRSQLNTKKYAQARAEKAYYKQEIERFLKNFRQERKNIIVSYSQPDTSSTWISYISEKPKVNPHFNFFFRVWKYRNDLKKGRRITYKAERLNRLVRAYHLYEHIKFYQTCWTPSYSTYKRFYPSKAYLMNSFINKLDKDKRLQKYHKKDLPSNEIYKSLSYVGFGKPAFHICLETGKVALYESFDIHDKEAFFNYCPSNFLIQRQEYHLQNNHFIDYMYDFFGTMVSFEDKDPKNVYRFRYIKSTDKHIMNHYDKKIKRPEKKKINKNYDNKKKRTKSRIEKFYY